MRKFLLVFFLLNLLLSTFYLDTWVSHNNTSRVLPVFSLYENGTWSFDPYHEQTIDKALVHGHYYSEKPPLPSFMVVPFYGLTRALGFGIDDAGNHYDKPVYLIGGFLAGSLPFSLFLTLLLATILRSRPKMNPVLLVMLPIYGSFFFIFSGTFFSHIISGALLLFGYWLLRYKEKYLWAGLCCGAAFLCEYSLAVIFPVWLVLLWLNKRNFSSVVIFGLGMAPAVLFLLFYNYLIGGDPFKMLYSYIATDDFAPLRSNLGFRLPDPLAMLGLLFSNYRGLFYYFPALLLLAFAVIRKRKFNLRSLLLNYWVLGFLASLLLISSFFTPYGGWTYGPRYLLPVTFLVAFEGIRFLSRNPVPSWTLWLIGGIGMVMAWMAKVSVMYALPSEEMNPVFGYVVKKLKAGAFNESNLLSLFVGVDPKVSAMIWPLLFLAALWWLSKKGKALVLAN